MFNIVILVDTSGESICNEWFTNPNTAIVSLWKIQGPSLNGSEQFAHGFAAGFWVHEDDLLVLKHVVESEMAEVFEASDGADDVQTIPV